METTPILKISALDGGRIAVFPEFNASTYQYAYRAGLGVAWDQEKGCFISIHPGNWTAHQRYEKILSAVRSELGFHLTLTPTTAFESMPKEFEESIKSTSRTV